VEIKKRSVVDIIKEAGAQIVLEVLGINDIRDCFGKGNVGSCISMAVGFLPWGKILKAKRIGEALFRAFRGFVRHQRDMRWADDVLGGAACAVNSFTPDTRVVLASGGTKAIDEVSLGDELLAEDPTTGERQARPVEAVIRGDGEKQLVQITVVATDAPDEGKSVVATEGHPIWVEGPGEWREAGKIAVGDLLRTGAGSFVQVTAVRHFAQKQVVYNLTVSGVHTYFVQVGNNSVLTHNCGDAGENGVHLVLKYKDGWTAAQRAAADAKVAALDTSGNLVATQTQRAGTSAGARYRAAGGVVPRGSDVDHVIDLQLGGADEILNMSPLDASVNRSLGAQIARQLRGVEPGTRICSVSICSR
jgi:hypothetical protein